MQKFLSFFWETTGRSKKNSGFFFPVPLLAAIAVRLISHTDTHTHTRHRRRRQRRRRQRRRRQRRRRQRRRRRCCCRWRKRERLLPLPLPPFLSPRTYGENVRNSTLVRGGFRGGGGGGGGGGGVLRRGTPFGVEFLCFLSFPPPLSLSLSKPHVSRMRVRRASVGVCVCARRDFWVIIYPDGTFWVFSRTKKKSIARSDVCMCMV